MITLSPWWYLLALCGLLPWIGPWCGRNITQNVLRTILFITLAVAFSRPHLSRDDAAAQHVLILDRSDSMDASAAADATADALEFSHLAEKKDRHLILIGTAKPDEFDSWHDHFESVTPLSSASAAGSSPLSLAISHAVTKIPRTGNGSVTLASDGLSTRPDDARAIATLRLRDIPVDVIQLPARSLPPTPVGVTWKDDLRVGASVVVTATIVARRSNNLGQVLLKTNDVVLASARYNGAARATVPLEFEPPEAGFIDAEIVVRADGSQSEQSLSVVLPVQPPKQVLYVSDLQQDGAKRLSQVLGSGFDIFNVDASEISSFQQALATADLVVLDDCQADSIPKASEQPLIDAVTGEGLGLLMSGGRASFGAGGWHNRAVESLLPVELVQKEEKRDPSTTLVVVIDTSGSMSGVRVQLAKEVARLAMRRLMPHDKVGIVEFYGAKRWAAPIQPASNAIELQRALNRMDAGGGTVILPALEEAFYGLQNVDTRYKHVLVLTDGGVESGDFESLMRRMAGEGINVSTVLAGGGYHSEFLVNIANWGKGRFYNVPNRFNLPEILLKQPSTAKLPAYRPGMHRVRARGGPGWWGDVDTTAVPDLAGYVEAKSRPGSQVLLETVDDRHPVLTTWRYGLGRVTTLCTEPLGEGTRPWRDWSEYGQALARVLERSAADTRDPFRFQLVHDGGDLQIHAIRQRPRTGFASDAVPLARLHETDSPSIDKQSLTFTAMSPDRFVAKITAAPIGETRRIECSSSTTPGRWHALVAASPVVAEIRVDPRQGIDLSALAAASDGEQIKWTDNWSSNRSPGFAGMHLIPLSSWFFGLALILFLAEVIWRRRPHGEVSSP